MKKITLMLCILLLSIIFVKAQTLGLTGPASAGSDENITLTFTGETRAKFASSVMVDYGGSTYNTYFIVIDPVTSFQSSAGGTPASKFNIKIYNTDSGNQNVTIKFTYGYNGTGGAGEGSVSRTITITPVSVVTPPVVTPPTNPVDPTIPTHSDLNISFGYAAGEDFSTLNGKHFTASSISLFAWVVRNNISDPLKFYAEASTSSEFLTVTAREQVNLTGFTNGIFPNQGFTQDTYVRMKTIYRGNEYYSNVLFVPAITGAPRTYIDPTLYQNELVLSPGSNISSFSATSASLARYIQDNELNSTQYKISYAYWVNTNNVNFLEVNSTNISSADFNAANIPAFTQKLFLRLKFEFNSKIFYSRYIVEVPTQ